MATQVFPSIDSKGLRIPNPARPIPEGIQTNNLIVSFDSGHEQRRKKGESRKTWELEYPVLSQAAYDTLQSFFLARGGSIEAFYWDHPVTKVRYLVRFNSDTLQSEYISQSTKFGAVWKISFKLIQLLHG